MSKWRVKSVSVSVSERLTRPACALCWESSPGDFARIDFTVVFFCGRGLWEKAFLGGCCDFCVFDRNNNY